MEDGYMKRERIRRIVAFVLILALMVPFGNPSFAVEADSSGEGEFFALSVIYDGDYIIAPEKVFYGPEDTIRDALMASPHEFTGINTGGFITSVDGQGESFSLFYDDMAYDLDVPAGSVATALLMTNGGEAAYSPEMLALIKVLAVHQDLPDEEKIFPSVKAAYEAAFEGLKTCDGEGAAPLLADLTAAYGEYEAWAASGSVRISFQVTLEGEPVTDAEIKAVDSYGFQYVSGDGEQFLDLKPGDYEFTVTKDNRVVQGTVTASSEAGQQTVSAPLPEGTWLSDISIRSAAGSSSPVLTLTAGENYYTRDLFVPDDSNTFYPYMTLGAGDGTSATASLYEPYFYSDMGRTDKRTWSSYSTSVAGLFVRGYENSRATLEIIHPIEGGLTQKQFYNFDLRRVPSVKKLSVTEDNGNSPDLGFDRYKKEYAVTVTSDHLTVSASCEYREDGKPRGTATEGYKIFIDGADVSDSGERRVPISDGSVITVCSEGPNGEMDEYHITVSLKEPVQVVLNHPSGTDVNLISASGSVISPDSDDGRTAVFSAAPGEYSWDTTLEQYYHARGTFTVAEDGATLSTLSPVKEVLLSNLALKAGVPANTKVYDQAEPFDPENHEITCLIPDTAGTFYVFPTVADGVSATRGGYYDMSGKFREESTITGKYANCPQFITYGGRNNSLILRVSRESQGITYYQDYPVSTSRIASLVSLSAFRPEGPSVPMYRNVDGGEDVSETFDPEVLTYFVKVPRSTEELRFEASISQAGLRNSEYLVSVGEETWSSVENGNKFRFNAELNTDSTLENVKIKVSTPEEENVDSEYSVLVIKLPPVFLRINVTPEDSLVSVLDDTTGERIGQGEDGRFELLPGNDYTCSITRNGYVGVTRKVNITEDTEIDVTLDPAQENSGLNTDLTEEWPRFRFDENNNGVTDYPLPYEREKATIYWANKIGEGYGANATGCPIMAGGYLYTYASRTILKIDPMTGKAVASGQMAAGSSFAINSPTYADGMIFVALSNGKIQAFNAETLESLWLYQDPLGGQPNCPISYCDGYIYTGFWVSETKKANFVCVSTTDEDPASCTELKTACWTVKDNGFYWAGAYVGPAGYGTDDEQEDRTYIIVGTDDGDSGFITEGGNLLSVDKTTGVVIDRIDDVCTGDIRSSICYDTETDRFFFTSKGGYFCSIRIKEDGTFDRESLKTLYLTNGSVNPATPPMSTSTPCVYNGRAYIGVSGTGAYSAYTGHNITVIDIEKNEIAYTVPTQGYPQTSGLVTTAYSEEDGSVYVYFFDNYTPGVLRVLRDKPGQTEADRTVTETDSYGNTHEVAYCLFSPYGPQAQYAICSPIADEYGNIYFKNDSAYMMMVGPTIERLDVTKMPVKTKYEAGEIFDPEGMEITAVYSNGISRIIPSEYLSVPQDPLTSDDIEINIRLDLGEHMVTYNDKDGVPGTVYDPPMASVPIEVSGSGGALEGGIIRIAGASRFDTAIAAANHLKEQKKLDAFDALIVASGMDFPDALSASYLSYKKDAPILLVGKDEASISKVTGFINENLADEGKVYIVGGAGAVTPAVAEGITVGEVIRLAGSNRFATNTEVLNEAGLDGEDLIVASGTGFADALSASAAKRPILLVGSTLTADQTDYLTEHSSSMGNKIYIAGGKGAVPESVENQLAPFGEITRFAGANRYDTSVKIAMEFFGGDLDTVVIASGKTFPDGLSGGPCAIYYEAPLILVAEGYTDNPRAIFVNSKAYRLVVMGGSGAVSREIAETIAYPATE